MQRDTVRVVASGLLATCLSWGGATGVTAADTGSLDALLHEKGILTDDEYESLQAAPPGAGGTAPTVTLGGRVMIDAAAYRSDDAELSSGTEVRRARLFVKGHIKPDWFYKAQYEFTEAGMEGIRDLYVGYAGLPHDTILRIGHFFEYGSLEDSTSSRYITFMERALPIATFVPAERRIGVGVDTHGECWYAGAGTFGESAATDESEDDGLGASARASLAPVNQDGRTVHLGVFGQWREPGSDTVRYRARPDTHVSDYRPIDTHTISNVNATAMYGLEAAWVHGPLSLQGEYVGVSVDRDGFATETYDGYYVYASWFLTGESRPYDTAFGIFERVSPKRCVGDGGMGAWEVALRFSNLDLHGEVDGGEMDSVTLGLNWYTTSHTRFMLNFVRSSSATAEGDVDIDTVAMRAQVDF